MCNEAGEMKSWMGDASLVSCLKSLPLDTLCTIFFHNADFDIRVFLTVKGLRVKGPPTIRGAGQIIRLAGEYKKRTFVMKCSYAFLAAPLSSLPKSYGIDGVKKQVTPYIYMDKEIVYRNKGVMLREAALRDIATELGEEFPEFMTNAEAVDGCLSDTTIDLYLYQKYYCEQDVTVLRLAFTKFRNVMTELLGPNYDPVNFCTITSVGHRYLEDKQCYSGLFKLTQAPRIFIQRSVIGGRTTSAGMQKFRLDWRTEEAKKLMGEGHMKFDHNPMVEGGGLEDVDGNSMYPSATVRCGGYPKGLPRVIEPHQRSIAWLEENADAYWAEVQIVRVGKYVSIPVMSYLDNSGIQTTRVFTNDMVGKVVILSDIQVTHWRKRHDCEFKVLRGYYFADGMNTSVVDIVKEWYDRRLVAKSRKAKAVAQALKLLLNSALFGRSIMRVKEEELTMHSEKEYYTKLRLWYNSISCAGCIREGNLYWIKRRVGTACYSSLPQVGTRILAESKVLFDELLGTCDALDNCPTFFTDTDSLHLLSKDTARVAKKYEETYPGRRFFGKQLGQYSSDLDNPCPQGYIDCEEPKSMFTIYAGKKCYLDTIVSSGRAGPGKPREWFAKYHVRMKGVPSASVQHCADLWFDGNIEAVYERLYEGLPTTFDLTCSGTRFCAKRDKTNLSIVSLSTMSRVLSFPISKHAWAVKETHYITPRRITAKRKYYDLSYTSTQQESSEETASEVEIE
jgi:hypothetical protein